VAALCLIVDVQTDGRTHGRTFLHSLLGHLSGDDLINWGQMSIEQRTFAMIDMSRQN